MPDVSNNTPVDDALDDLEVAGFTNIRLVDESGNEISGQSGVVIAQSPVGGTRVVPSTQITLTVRR